MIEFKFRSLILVASVISTLLYFLKEKKEIKAIGIKEGKVSIYLIFLMSTWLIFMILTTLLGL